MRRVHGSRRLNYDEDATIPAFNVQSDGTAVDACVYAGCTFYWACNYDPAATVNDGSCDLESCAGCQIEEACNYDPEATLSGDCTFAAEGYDYEGNCLLDSDMDGCAMHLKWKDATMKRP